MSTDPLAPALGAGWDGNPYSFAGNNPLGFSDPSGLKPMTDEELKAYDKSSRSWWSDNWEYVVGGAMVLGGGVLMATGVGGPLGMMLVGAGADTIIQKATTGSVDWGEVALSGAMGGFGGASIAAKAGLTGLKGTLVAGASSGGISGGVQGSYSYLTGPGPHTIDGALVAAGTGTVFGAALGGAGGAVGQGASKLIMGAVTRNAGADTVVMGRMMPQRVHPYGEANGYGTYEALPKKFYDFTQNRLGPIHDDIHMWANKKWINYQMMQGKKIIDIGAPDPILNSRYPGQGLPPSNYYDMELGQVQGYSGYSQDWQPSWDLG